MSGVQFDQYVFTLRKEMFEDIIFRDILTIKDKVEYEYGWEVVEEELPWEKQDVGKSNLDEPRKTRKVKRPYRREVPGVDLTEACIVILG